LRKHKNYKERDSIVNMGSSKNPFWRVFKEYEQPRVELSRVPDIFAPISTSTKEAFHKTLNHFKVKNEDSNFLSKKNRITGKSSEFNFGNIKDISQIYVSLIFYIVFIDFIFSLYYLIYLVRRQRFTRVRN